MTVLLVAVSAVSVVRPDSARSAATTLPGLYSDTAQCPEQDVMYHGHGFAPNTLYTVTLSVGTPSHDQVLSDADGRLSFFVTVGAGTAGQVSHIAVVPPEGSGLASASLDKTLPSPVARDVTSGYTLAGVGDQLPLRAECFIPGDSVTISSPQLAFDSATATVDSIGQVQWNGKITRIVKTGTAQVSVSAAESGTATTAFTIRTDALNPGTELDPSEQTGGRAYAISPSGRVTFGLLNGTFGVFVLTSPNTVYDGADVVWPHEGLYPPARPDGSRLLMQANGNLVLRDAANRVLWASGTTGVGNRLVVHDDGNVAIHQGTKVVWATGRYPVPLPGYRCEVRGMMFGLPNPSSPDGKLVSTETGYAGTGANMLRAPRTTGAHSQYRICATPSTAGSRLAYIQSVRTGRFVSAELDYTGDNYGMLRARATTVGKWEMFRLVPHNSNLALQSTANGRYVSAEFGYKGSRFGMLRARATVAGPWETWANTS